jgi:hypothetical protein
MTLDFTQLTEQVQMMGAAFDKNRQTLSKRLELALQKLQEWSEREEEVHAQVWKAENVQYRGATPIGDTPEAHEEVKSSQGPIEFMVEPVPLPDCCPERATLVAVDGSQIYLDPRSDVHYYLINTGTITIHHGDGGAPLCEMLPTLHYEDEDIYPGGRLIRNSTINARRTIKERETLADAACQPHAAQPVIALADGPLLFWEEAENAKSDGLLSPVTLEYLDALARLRPRSPEQKIGLAGYVDKPTSAYVVRLLHLLNLIDNDERPTREALATNGEFEGVNDRMLFRDILEEPGSRSALFVQRSPTNREYAQYKHAERQGDLEIAFFYFNAASPGEQPYLARVEVPMWVARDRELVAQVQRLIHEQCELVSRRYPYIITRADEIAAVEGFEKRQLDSLIRIELHRRGIPVGDYDKAQSKDARAGRSGGD